MKDLGTVKEKLDLQTNIMFAFKTMTLLLGSPNPNYGQYDRLVNHLYGMLVPYADDGFKTAMRKIRVSHQAALRRVKSSKAMGQLVADYHQALFIEINFLIKRLGLGLEEETEEIW